MKSNELRIGNLVYGINRRSDVHLPNTLPLKVLQIELFNCEVLPFDKNPATEKEYFKLSNADLTGIPLTEDWLLRFGCLKQRISSTKKNYWNQKLDFSIDVEFTLLQDNPLFFYLIHNQLRRKPIQYVHQLQNLYFALTGSELHA